MSGTGGAAGMAIQPWQQQDPRFDPRFGRGAEEEEEKKPSRLQVLAYKVLEWAKGLDSVRWALLTLALFLAFWVLSVSILLIRVSVEYLSVVADRERTEYTASGTTSWAIAEASRWLSAPHVVRDALRVSLRGGLVGGPWDLSMMEQVLAPIFATVPYIRSVELMFADAPKDVLAISHDGEGENGLRVLMRSNSEQCYVLGPDGCLSDPPSGKMPTWFAEASSLGLLDGAGVSNDNDTHAMVLQGDAYAWGDGVEMVLEAGSGSSWSNRTWYPSYRLMFKLVDAPGGDGYSLVGRIAFEVGGLTGARLQDDRLGEEGRVYLCDRVGYVVASSDYRDLLTLDANTSRPLPRSFGDISSLPSSARSAAMAAIGRGVGASELLDDGAYVVVEFLPEPLERFAVVVVAPNREPFMHDRMRETSIACIVFACMPYIAALAALVAIVVRSRRKRGDEGDEDDDDDDDRTTASPHRTPSRSSRGAFKRGGGGAGEAGEGSGKAGGGVRGFLQRSLQRGGADGAAATGGAQDGAIVLAGGDRGG